MKKLVCLFIALISFAAFAAEPYTIRVEEQALVISAEGSETPEVAAMPEVPGIGWLGRGMTRRTENINGRVRAIAETVVYFHVSKPGEYTVPSFRIRIGRKQYDTKPFTFRVVEQKAQRNGGSSANIQRDVSLDKAIFLKLLLPEHKTVCYSGEDIPVEADLLILEGIRVQGLQGPEITAENRRSIVFRDYSSVNPRNPKFEPETTRRVELNGETYTVIRFRTVLNCIETGELRLKVAAVAGLEQVRRPSFNDPFMEDFFDFPMSARVVPHELSAKADEVIQIKPLPKFDQTNAVNLGLVGDWKIEPSLSAEKAEVGGAVTLKVELEGTGATGNLRAPELNIPGFRVYQPEVSRGPYEGHAEIRYLMVPTQPGKKKIDLQFAVFNVNTGKYDVHPFRTELNVEKAKNTIAGAVGPKVLDTAETKQPESAEDVRKQVPAGILYLKHAPFKEVFLPLRRNSELLWLILIAGGVILAAAGEFYGRRMQHRDAGSDRRSAAHSAKSGLLRSLRGLPPEKCSEHAFEIAEYVNNAMNFPPGTSLEEISGKIQEKYPEESEALKELSAGAWSPLGSAFTAEKRDKLIRFLSRLACLMLACLPLAVFAGEDPAAAAYNAGNFAEAEQLYRSELKVSAPSAELLYNIGNTLYQQGEYGKAIVCYERARLLAPRDNDIEINLNLARRKLQLREKYQLETPGDIPLYLRNLMRPDEWITFACAGVFLLLAGFGLRRFMKKSALVLGGIGIIMILLGAGCALSREWQDYAPDRMFVENFSKLCELPVKDSNGLSPALSPGDRVRVLEKRNGWALVQTESNAEGWIPEKDLN